MSMHSPEIEKARAEWNTASNDCARILHQMALLDVEEPVYGELVAELAEATARRKAAGDVEHRLTSAAITAIDKKLKAMR